MENRGGEGGGDSPSAWHGSKFYVIMTRLFPVRYFCHSGPVKIDGPRGMIHETGSSCFFYLTVLGLLIFCPGLTACSTGPFSPEARQQAGQRDRYLKALQSGLVADDTFEWSSLSSALIVRALPYTAQLAGVAEDRFRDDPTFYNEVSSWSRLPGGAAGPPVIVLMGLFAPDLKAGDITKLGRFRPRLAAADGRIMSPAEVKRFGRDSVFIRDHFPVFNPWEEVFLVKFASPGPAGSSGPIDFRLEWPGGAQTLLLNVR